MGNHRLVLTTEIEDLLASEDLLEIFERLGIEEDTVEAEELEE